jgi:hypothetical protein
MDGWIQEQLLSVCGAHVCLRFSIFCFCVYFLCLNALTYFCGSLMTLGRCPCGCCCCSTAYAPESGGDLAKGADRPYNPPHSFAVFAMRIARTLCLCRTTSVIALHSLVCVVFVCDAL